MMFMNRDDIEQAVQRFQRDPVLGPAALFLRRFQVEVDQHSDGWPYWSPPCKAAGKLQALLHAHLWAGMGAYPQVPKATEGQVLGCLTPIKAFMTTRGRAAGMTLPPLPYEAQP